MKRFWFFFLLSVVLIVPIVGASAQDDDTLIIRSIGNMSTLNPILWTDGGSWNLVSQLWPAPIDIDGETGLPIPGLTTWEVSEDGLIYTFRIREDAVWSDGTPITANDAKFTYDAAASPVVASPRISNTASFEEVRVIDDKTYQVVLKEVNCGVYQDFYSIRWMPSHRFAADFSDVLTNPLNEFSDISGGAYILEEIQPDQFQRLRANPTYWRGQPEIENLIFRVITDPAVSIQSLQAGETDYDLMEADLFQQIPNPDQFQWRSLAQDSVGLFFMNWANPDNPQPAYDEEGNLIEQDPHPIFSDVRVRQAVAMGYDKNAILGSLGENAGVRLVGSVVPAISWAFASDLEPWPYDPERAAALLDEAGWVDHDNDPTTPRIAQGAMYAEDGTPLSFEIVYSPVTGYFETTALVAQDQLSQLGMDVSVTSMEWASYLNDVLLAQRFDASIVSWGGFPPPDPVSTEPLTISTQDIPGQGFNLTSYVNPEYDELLRQGRAVVGCSPEERAAIYREVQQIQRDEVAVDFTISPNTFHVMNARVSNFNPESWWNLQDRVWELGIGLGG